MGIELIIVGILVVTGLRKTFKAVFGTDEHAEPQEMEDETSRERRKRVVRIGATLLSGLMRWK